MSFSLVSVPKPATAETWMTQGVCRENPAMWDARTGTPGYDPEAIGRCLACPVLDECREWALSDQMLPLLTGSGVIAGMTSQDRTHEHTKRHRDPLDRDCLHCEKPLPRTAHHNRVVHSECKRAWEARQKRELWKNRNETRTCRQCGTEDLEPRKQYCQTCREIRRRATHHRNNQIQAARRAKRAERARQARQAKGTLP